MTRVGIWKQRDLAKPVGIAVRAWRPSTSASITDSWPARNASKPKTSQNTLPAAPGGHPPNAGAVLPVARLHWRQTFRHAGQSALHGHRRAPMRPVHQARVLSRPNLWRMEAPYHESAPRRDFADPVASRRPGPFHESRVNPSPPSRQCIPGLMQAGGTGADVPGRDTRLGRDRGCRGYGRTVRISPLGTNRVFPRKDEQRHRERRTATRAGVSGRTA